MINWLTIYPNHPHLHHASIRQWLGSRKARLSIALSAHYRDKIERWLLRRVAKGLVTTYPKKTVGFGYALFMMRANSRLWSSRSRGSSSAEKTSVNPHPCYLCVRVPYLVHCAQSRQALRFRRRLTILRWLARAHLEEMEVDGAWCWLLGTDTASGFQIPNYWFDGSSTNLRQ